MHGSRPYTKRLGPLRPLGRSLFADKKRQDKQTVRQVNRSYAGRKLIKLLGSNHIAIRQCCVNIDTSWLLATWTPRELKEGLGLSELWRLVLAASSGVTVEVLSVTRGEFLNNIFGMTFVAPLKCAGALCISQSTKCPTRDSRSC